MNQFTETVVISDTTFEAYLILIVLLIAVLIALGITYVIEHDTSKRKINKIEKELHTLGEKYRKSQGEMRDALEHEIRNIASLLSFEVLNDKYILQKQDSVTNSNNTVTLKNVLNIETRQFHTQVILSSDKDIKSVAIANIDQIVKYSHYYANAYNNNQMQQF